MVKFYNISDGEITAQCETPITVLKISNNSFTRLARELGMTKGELEERMLAPERCVEYNKCICIATRSYVTLIETLALYTKYQYASIYNLGRHGWYASIEKGGEKK